MRVTNSNSFDDLVADERRLPRDPLLRRLRLLDRDVVVRDEELVRLVEELRLLDDELLVLLPVPLPLLLLRLVDELLGPEEELLRRDDLEEDEGELRPLDLDLLLDDDDDLFLCLDAGRLRLEDERRVFDDRSAWSRGSPVAVSPPSPSRLQIEAREELRRLLGDRALLGSAGEAQNSSATFSNMRQQCSRASATLVAGPACLDIGDVCANGSLASTKPCLRVTLAATTDCCGSCSCTGCICCFSAISWNSWNMSSISLFSLSSLFCRLRRLASLRLRLCSRRWRRFSPFNLF